MWPQAIGEELGLLPGSDAENRRSMSRLPRFVPFGKMSPIS
jgi:hypothetical protein